MVADADWPRFRAPSGEPEPHRSLLTVPDDEHLLYKVMTVENLLRSLDGGYLHFNRVDSYSDFPGADVHDGEQGPSDRPGNATSKFELDPTFSVADYYDKARGRTYACCVSLSNGAHLWDAYGTGGSQGKVCLVFRFGRLRAQINGQFSHGAHLSVGGSPCTQIFSVNYGNVDYVDWKEHRANQPRLPNPIQYTYLKDQAFSAEHEHRITLSALGIGEFWSTSLGGAMTFPESLQLAFDFKRAAAEGALVRCLHDGDCDPSRLNTELQKRGFDACGESA